MAPLQDPLLHERVDELEMLKPVLHEKDATDPSWRWPNVPLGSVYETMPLVTDSSGQVWTARGHIQHGKSV